MSRFSLARGLEELREAPTRARAWMVAEGLAEHLDRADAEQRSEYLELIERYKLMVPSMPSVRLEVGETWLLVQEPIRGGRAVRLHARPYPASAKALHPPAGEVDRAFHGLLSTVAQACRRLPWNRVPPPIEVDLPRDQFHLEGSSLGLSVAVALLSAALNIAPSAQTAGSATLLEDGRLHPVEHLPSKIAALQRSWPDVRQLVVAKNQTLPEGYKSPIPLEHASTLKEALPFFELSLSKLQPGSLEEHEARIGSLTKEVSEGDSSQWSALASEAWESARALLEHRPDASARGAIFATQFANHAGDYKAAAEFASSIPDKLAEEHPEIWAHKLIVEASAAIDSDDFEKAITLASHAVESCSGLVPGLKRQLLGQALGTHGRALLHLGNLGEAEPLLRKAMEHHAGQKDTERARSACYLATCQRLAGRPEEALALVEEALSDLDGQTVRWRVGETTRLYLSLEKGRCLAALKRWPESVTELRAVYEGQPSKVAYPKLGAMRSLAHSLRKSGEAEAADEVLRACLSIAAQLASEGSRRTLQRVAATAAGEALLAEEPVNVPKSHLEETWSAAFPNAGSSAERAVTLATWVY